MTQRIFWRSDNHIAGRDGEVWWKIRLQTHLPVGVRFINPKGWWIDTLREPFFRHPDWKVQVYKRSSSKLQTSKKCMFFFGFSLVPKSGSICQVSCELRQRFAYWSAQGTWLLCSRAGFWTFVTWLRWCRKSVRFSWFFFLVILVIFFGVRGRVNHQKSQLTKLCFVQALFGLEVTNHLTSYQKAILDFFLNRWGWQA